MTSKRVLVAPLDWGLGHATRCIPIINHLLEANCDVVIAGNGQSLDLLRFEFPSLLFVELPAYNPVYPTSGSMTISMIRQLPKFIRAVKNEHAILERIIQEHIVDVVISDNRFGCWSARVKSIFITHQVNILMPGRLRFLSRLVNYFNHRMIGRYHACWVPDHADRGLSGELTYSNSLKCDFIGPISRFVRCLPMSQSKYTVLVLLSGPESQRTLLEEIILKQLKTLQVKALVIRGIPGTECRKIEGEIEVIDFLTGPPLNKVICESEIIIARSGYSTIMDLAKLGKRAILIPTPGQTEQEYLARELHDKRIAYTMSQKRINLEKALDEVSTFKGFSELSENRNLKNTIFELVR